jgi:murein DD-endopeptidase MepM/ murein hydrolase activator NlpD
VDKREAEVKEEKLNSETEDKKVEVYAEKAEQKEAELQVEDVRAAALAYAKYLKEKGLKPGDATFTSPEELGVATVEKEKKEKEKKAKKETKEEVKKEAKKEVKKAAKKEAKVDAKKEFKEETKKEAKDIRSVRRHRKIKTPKIKPYEKSSGGSKILSAAIDSGDKLQDGIDTAFTNAAKDFAKQTHNIATSYRNTRRTIGAALLTIGVICAAMLIIFDRFTVYEYAYNGKVLGYVKEQEEVTDVLRIAGEKLTENSGRKTDISFEANQNVTFNLVDSSNKSLDDADAAVNKLVYMTDIESPAFGVYDGDNLVAIVKSYDDAEQLLDDAMAELSRPDKGMELVSAEFVNKLDIRELNVLLTSIQSNNLARSQMTQGGDMEIYHIVEEGETLSSLCADYSVEPEDIFEETNNDVVAEVVQGDKICIHKTVDPVEVLMVEEGRMKETIEFKTVKKDSDEYYKGDTYVEQEGRDGVQIFEGSITKKSGEVIERDEDNIETIRKVKNKIILVGTAERPKTAATGVFAMPIQNYTITSGFGARWGRLHRGIDFAAPTGTPIYASDGGTVITSGISGGYGNCIDIDHENGKVTRYGHCSQLLVGLGEKVYQGQLIGLVGSTGNSTGAHLHFEIIVNGSPTDPMPFLGL